MTATIHNPVQRDSVTFLETVSESGGERTYLEIDLAAGGGNRLHRHLAYAEHFEVLEGTLAVPGGKQRIRLGAGEMASAPAVSRHRFANDTGDSVRFRVEITPGHAGFERALRVAYGLAADGETGADGVPKRISDLALLSRWSEIRVCGPLAALNPLLGFVARRSAARERELTERYVGQDT